MLLFNQIGTNVALVATLALIYSLFPTTFKKKHPSLMAIVLGVLFGLTTGALQQFPVTVAPGVIIDGKSIVPPLAGFFFGPLAAVIAAIIASTYRFGLGGQGTLAGVYIIFTGAALGVLFHEIRRRQHLRHTGVALLLLGGVVASNALMGAFIMPFNVALGIVSRVWVVVLIVYPLGILLTGILLQAIETRNNSIEEMVRATNDLRESEERFRLLAENSTDMISRHTPEGIYLYASPASERLMGYSPEDLIGHSSYEFIEPDDIPNVEQSHSTILEKQVVFTVVYRIKRKDGKFIWLETTSRTIPDPETGAAMEIHAATRDISERKEQEAQIVAHQAELQRLLKESDQSRHALLISLEEQKLADEVIRRRLAEMEAINHISTALRTAQTLGEMLPLLLDETLAALESDAGSIWLYHAEKGELYTAVTRGWYDNFKEMAVKPDDGIAGVTFTTGKPYISREFAHDPLVSPLRVDYIPENWGGICVPIRTADEIAGVLFLSVPLPREITTQEATLLYSVAEMAGTALHRLRLYEETHRQLEYLQSLRLIDQAITTSFDSHATVAILLNQAISRLHVDAAGILLFNPHSYVLEYAAGYGFHQQAYKQSIVHLGEGLAGEAALHRHLVQSSNLLEEPDFTRKLLLDDEGFQAYFAMPLIAKGELKGMLEVFHRKSLRPNAEWLNFLDALGGQAAIAIDNFQLFEGLQRSNIELVHAYDATIEGWSRALDLRDKETEGHTLRVTEMTVQLARAAGVSDAELVQVKRGALLHDIGKMGIPDSILLKPGKLTLEEMTFMKKHPVFALEFLSPIHYLQGAAIDIPYCHHEKWDGTGYPRGLKANEIPFIARLFTVVDVWDALTSDRPYRAGWSTERVRKYIRKQSGTHFDPEAVELFFRVFFE